VREGRREGGRRGWEGVGKSEERKERKEAIFLLIWKEGRRLMRVFFFSMSSCIWCLVISLFSLAVISPSLAVISPSLAVISPSPVGYVCVCVREREGLRERERRRKNEIKKCEMSCGSGVKRCEGERECECVNVCTRARYPTGKVRTSLP